MFKSQRSIISTVFVTLTSLSLNAQSIKDLNFLIGKWKVEETMFPGTERSYLERGIRTCEYFLDNSFIHCETQTTNSKTGKQRTYAYLINYDYDLGCFTAAVIANDFPKIGIDQWHLNKKAKEIRIVSPRAVKPDRFFRGVLSYDDRDQLVWNYWASLFASEKEWKQIFNEVSVRIEE